MLEQVKTERSHVLIQLGKEHMEKYMSHFVGQEVEILFEETMEIKGETYWTGHTKEYLRAAVKTEKTWKLYSYGESCGFCRRWDFYLHNIIVEFPNKIY